MYQSDPVGVELLSYVNTFVGFMLHSLCTKASEVKLHISSFDLHVIQRKQLIEKSHTFCVHIYAFHVQTCLQRF